MHRLTHVHANANSHSIGYSAPIVGVPPTEAAQYWMSGVVIPTFVADVVGRTPDFGFASPQTVVYGLGIPCVGQFAATLFIFSVVSSGVGQLHGPCSFAFGFRCAISAEYVGARCFPVVSF